MFLFRRGFRAEPAREAVLYERCTAPVGVAGQTEGELPSFSSTPAGRSSFSQQEKKKRGLQKSIFVRSTKNFSAREAGKKASPLTQRAKKALSGREKEMWGANASLPLEKRQKASRSRSERNSLAHAMGEITPAYKAENFLTSPLLSAAPAGPYTKSSLRPRWAR